MKEQVWRPRQASLHGLSSEESRQSSEGALGKVGRCRLAHVSVLPSQRPSSPLVRPYTAEVRKTERKEGQVRWSSDPSTVATMGPAT